MKRILVFLFGVVLVLVTVEAGLRFIGLVSKKNTDVPTSALFKQQGKPFIILCLGNSYTEGVGAPPCMSYPAQLNRMCDERMKGKNIIVINKGEGAQNTAELLGDLKVNIKTYRPDLIILQTGQPNEWNYLKHTDYLRRKDRAPTFLKLAGYYFRELLSESRVFRLCLLFNENFKNKPDHAGPLMLYRQQKDYIEAMQFIRTISTRLAVDRSFVVDQGMLKRSLGVFMEGVKKDPEWPLNYTAVGYLYRLQGNFDEALKYFIKGLTVGRPGDRNKIFTYQGMRRLRQVDKGRRNEEINNRVDKFIDVYSQRNPDIAFQLRFLSDAEIVAWIESDLKEIIAVIQHERIRVIVQNYPRSISVNMLLSRVSNELKLPFVDNYKIFQEKIFGGIPEEDLFVPDGHCNARGYGVMAENVFNEIRAEGF